MLSVVMQKFNMSKVIFAIFQIWCLSLFILTNFVTVSQKGFFNQNLNQNSFYLWTFHQGLKVKLHCKTFNFEYSSLQDLNKTQGIGTNRKVDFWGWLFSRHKVDAFYSQFFHTMRIWIIFVLIKLFNSTIIG